MNKNWIEIKEMNYVFSLSTKKGKEDYGNISARYRKNGINRKYSISFCITLEEWDNYRLHNYKSNTMMQSIGITYDQFVKILEKIKHYFDKEYVHEDVPKNIREIKTEVIHGTTEAARSKKRNGYFLDAYIKQYYEELMSGKRLKMGRTVKVQPSSAANFMTLYRKIQKFQRNKYRRYRLEDVNMDFQREMVSWLKKKGHFPNGIHTIMKNIWTAMRAAFEDHYTENDVTRFPEFIPHEVLVEDITLSQQQIQTLYNMDISTVEKVQELIEANVKSEKRRNLLLSELGERKVATMNKCRDIFIVGCLTGQRISDYSRINKGMITRIRDEWFIRLVQKKTGKKVYIPLCSDVKTIIDKYNGQLPDVSITCLNLYLGRIFEYIGWDWKPDIDKSRLGRRRGYRFCDMVSTHTARRSFATNAYTSGVRVESIMAVTGHSEERMFRRYLKLGTEDRALKAAEDFAGVMEL